MHHALQHASGLQTGPGGRHASWVSRVFATPEGFPRVMLAVWLVAGIALVSTLGGCAGAPRRESVPNPGEVLPSRGGTMAIVDARARWDELLVAQHFGAERQRDLDRVIESIDQAIASDPKFPLFLSKKGDMLLENPQPQKVAEARRLYQASLGPGLGPGATTGSERWAPGWIGLARCAALDGDAAAALKHLDSADGAITWLDAAQPPRMGGLLGLILDPPPPPDDPRDPRLAESTRKSLIVAAMTEDAAWDLSARPLGEADPAQAAIDVKRRYRGEIEFQRALIERDPDDPAAFEQVFAWNPDHFQARLEKTRRLVKFARFEEAQATLRPYADLSNPKLARESELLLLMAEIHTRRYLQTGALDQAAQADGFLKLLDQQHPWDARAYILHARVLARWSKDTKDAAKLADAKRCLEVGEARLPAFKNTVFDDQVAEWTEEISLARRDIAAAGG